MYSANGGSAARVILLGLVLGAISYDFLTAQ